MPGKNIEKAFLVVTMPDGSKWQVPVLVIARNRAENYKDEFDGDVEKSLKEDTIPLFQESDYDIEDWAANNMDWDEVAQFATRREPPEDPDYQEGWVNGETEIIWE